MSVLGLGQDLSFFSLLDQQADAAVRAASVFLELSGDFGRADDYIRKIDEIEHEADEFTHQLANRVDRTFVTPLDKEDLHALSSRLDDVTDSIQGAARRISVYRLTSPRPDLTTLLELLVQITQATKDAVAALRHRRSRKGIQPLFIRIHELENRGDDTFNQAIAHLYQASQDRPLEFVAWKEVYDRIERAMDQCEDVANAVESVAVKYA